VTVWRIAPAASRRKILSATSSVTQTLLPSQRIPVGSEKEAATVVTLQGIVAAGVTIETDDARLADQIRDPSKVSAPEESPRVLETVVTTPAAWLGSIR